MTSLSEIANVLGFDKKTQYDTHTWGTVKSINSDGSYQVQLNASTVYTRCAKLCFANVGDRVFVCILANGTCAAIGRLGGSDSSATRGKNITGGKANDTREFWKKQPNGTYYFDAVNMLNGQPNQYGFLIHNCNGGNEIHQEFWIQPNGVHYRRGCNGSVTDMPGFYRITDDTQNPALLRYYNDSTHGNHAGLAMHTLADTGWIRTPKPGLLPWDNTGGGICDLGSGTSWQFRNIYSKNFVKNGKTVTGFKTIFNNDSNSAAAGVTLSETAANFAFLDIYTKSNDSYYTSTRVHAPNGKIVFLTNGWYPGSGTIKAQLKLRTVKISGTSIANNNSVQTSWGNDGLNRNNVVSIVRVDGWV